VGRVYGRSVLTTPRSVMDAPSLVFRAHGAALRLLSGDAGRHFTGLGQACRAYRNLTQRTKRRLTHLDSAAALLRHITQVGVDEFLVELENEIAAMAPTDRTPRAPTPSRSVAGATPAAQVPAGFAPPGTEPGTPGVFLAEVAALKGSLVAAQDVVSQLDSRHEALVQDLRALQGLIAVRGRVTQEGRAAIAASPLPGGESRQDRPVPGATSSSAVGTASCSASSSSSQVGSGSPPTGGTTASSALEGSRPRELRRRASLSEGVVSPSLLAAWAEINSLD